MADSCDVAIAGGGIVGLACALELRRLGAGRVVVLERDGALGRGSSARANGGVRAQFTTPVNIAFSLHSIGEYERLAHDDAALAFHQTGYLFVTGTEGGERWLRDACELQRRHGVATEWLDADAVAAHAPVVRTEGLRGATFHGRDGFLDPHAAVAALGRAARAAGAEIRTSCAVEGFDDAPGRAVRVATARGPLDARAVVVAAGAHARAVGALAGIDVPVDPIRRNLAFVRAPGHPDDLIPMCVDVDTGVLVRREAGGGYLVAYSNPGDRPGWDTSLDPAFLDDVAERIGNRFPSLENVPIDPRHCWAGLYPETADHHAIVGRAPERPELVVCAGFGGHGLMHAPAAGRAVAELVVDGRCTSFDLHALRPSRFAEGDLVVESATL
ncbi:MAG TPA: FAD-dependent oxidoreductase [Actinomycetota bacterium]|nr:FAD-dependent oxidoreductase [Actinomycetota bacterium]